MARKSRDGRGRSMSSAVKEAGLPLAGGQGFDVEL
jgi:hypothetical protein